MFPSQSLVALTVRVICKFETELRVAVRAQAKADVMNRIKGFVNRGTRTRCIGDRANIDRTRKLGILQRLHRTPKRRETFSGRNTTATTAAVSTSLTGGVIRGT